MSTDTWRGYNDDENRRRAESMDALNDTLWGQTQQEGPIYPTWPRIDRTSVKGFDSAAEADAFHADIARFLKGGNA